MDVTLVLTHDCNLGCGYCYAGRKRKRVMTDEVLGRAIDLAFADEAEAVQLGIVGGEPMLGWDKPDPPDPPRLKGRMAAPTPQEAPQ